MPDNSKFHVAIFAKAPVAGLAKTRLIPLLGAEGAAQAQQTMTLRALTTACNAAAGNVSLWSAGDFNHAFLQQTAREFGMRHFAQTDGDLGRRMRACLRESLQSQRKVVLIGTDCPALHADDLRAAAQALEPPANMVFIPAEDGGYVLVGAQAKSGDAIDWLDHAFDNIAWGSADVMRQTRARLDAMGWQAQHDWREMPTLWDVDTPADYERARRAGLL